MGAGRISLNYNTMNQTITLLGRDIPVAINMGTLLAFEVMTGKAFSDADVLPMEANLALLYSAILTADAKTDITIDMLRDCGNYHEFIAAANKVTAMLTEFLSIPAIVQEAEKDDLKEEADEKKNA